MSEEKSANDLDQKTLLASIRRRLGRLTIVLFVLIMLVVLQTVALYGNLVNYFGYDAQIHAGATLGAAFLGFLFGWFARRAA
jgi:F420-0:gamma-glutamyl ligase-like protein